MLTLKKNKRLPRIDGIYYETIDNEEHMAVRFKKLLQIAVIFFIPLTTYIRFLKSIDLESDPFIKNELLYYSNYEIIKVENDDGEMRLLKKIFNEQYQRFKEMKILGNDFMDGKIDESEYRRKKHGI